MAQKKHHIVKSLMLGLVMANMIFIAVVAVNQIRSRMAFAKSQATFVPDTGEDNFEFTE